MKALCIFSPMAFTVLVLALVVQATPVPTLNDTQIGHRNVQVDSSTIIRDSDGVDSIRSENPFDLHGMFVRADVTTDNDQDIPSILSDILKELATKKEEVDKEIASNIEPSHAQDALTRLAEMADEALRNKQTMTFLALQNKIQRYYRIDHLDGSYSVNDQIPIDARTFASEIYSRISKNWKGRDEKDMVSIRGNVPIIKSRPLFQYSSNVEPWDPLLHPTVLLPELQRHLEPDNVKTFDVQQLLDLGRSVLIAADTRRGSMHESAYNLIIVVGYQLMFMSALVTLEKFNNRHGPFAYILYLIRDAKYAEGNSDYVKARLTTFNKYLTDIGTEDRVHLQTESNWHLLPKEKKKGARSRMNRRQSELKARAVELHTLTRSLEQELQRLRLNDPGTTRYRFVKPIRCNHDTSWSFQIPSSLRIPTQELKSSLKDWVLDTCADPFETHKLLRMLRLFQVLVQVLIFASVIASGLMIWKGLGLISNCESPIVVVHGSIEPAFYGGDLLFLMNPPSEQYRTGDITVYKIPGQEIPIVHRVMETRELVQKKKGIGAPLPPPQLMLTKGDNNPVDDLDLYRGLEFLERKHIIGKVRG
ncbi:hypothetical protein H0H93_006022 [Arthromyces matolae]|nr:hypothetical protein H0H93_006022 [Arthromyces matolae]